jgi:hypothetical protein
MSKKVDRRVILDCKEFNSSISKMVFLPGAKNIQIQTNDHLNLSEEELLMCSFLVPGFFLATKRWYFLDVSGIKDITFNTTAFEKLVIPQDKKDLISSLITTIPQKEKSTFDDFIEGKGKGLIFLLHGPPGVGKTFTAG